MCVWSMQVVSGVMYKTPDGVERVARAHLTIVCDGMYSNLRKHLSEPNVSVAVCNGSCWNPAQVACGARQVGQCVAAQGHVLQHSDTCVAA